VKLISKAFVLVAASSMVMADEVDVPNQFASGARALASEVNENFSAVETAIDDNAQRVVALETAVGDTAQQVLALESALGGIGVPVSVDGAVVGRYIGFINPSVPVDVAGVGTVRLREAGGIALATEILVVSPTGYRFSVLTSDSPPLLEGQLDLRPIYYDGASCSGNAYHPVEGDTGFFSTFALGNGQFRPATRWAVRQGWVFRSPDPSDATPVYMLRRNAVPAVVALASRKLYSSGQGQAFCQTLANVAGFDVNNSLHVDNWVVPVEALDAAEAGVSGVLGGDIMVGL